MDKLNSDIFDKEFYEWTDMVEFREIIKVISENTGYSSDQLEEPFRKIYKQELDLNTVMNSEESCMKSDLERKDYREKGDTDKVIKDTWRKNLT